ncbi:MAG: prephenate/arogenate dehydrogenase family protein [Rhodospirillales bacterium]|nr:prephenate/arogenate dehydrogenase family protein [Rhodospirillales bacterium]
MAKKKKPHFKRVCLIGIGLIGSSLARVMRRDGLADHIVACARKAETLETVTRLGLADSVTTDPVEAVAGADLVIICTPIGAYDAVGRAIGPALSPGCIVSDVGSVKKAVIDALSPHLPDNVHLVPGHPIAGTEHSGPESGFETLFEGRWTLLTPPAGTDKKAVEKIAGLWRSAGSRIEIMDPVHHDQVLAITSHIPHLIAYTIVGTATDLEDHLKSEVIKYSAGGFRDFTRIAASDPVMWRDVFLNNRDAVLEMLGRFSEDLAKLQRAIRVGDGDAMEELFTRTREIRRGVVEAQQHVPPMPQDD